ncbi:uncharacterized protein LY89DRAFT_687763 [Mollisia scopiformis]|uniref:DUF8021 domain-containing protein n=1 Tax=Mollisia scopiformis TaxID=149040 RepID=A0A194WXV4_MOLSC|nr:uncharacterized protein LY89DRAFT_687763 [Mollisia scopiformis]KUJ12803.1 hypothetical protein LY89DRAFT_687763 [Mollisia scopiformis]
MVHINFGCSIAVFTLVSTATADCTRASLLAASENYLTAQGTGDLQPLFASDFTYLENNKTKDFNSSVLSSPLNITHNHTLLDTIACATYTELVITDPKKQYLIGTQIHYINTSGTSLQISMIDAIVSTTGDWQFNATKSLSYIESEDWSPLPTSSQSTRTYLLSTADAYLDLWGANNASAHVPWGTPCDRMEGSAYTGKGTPTDSCNVGIPTTIQLPNVARRYVVDEGMGCVSVLCVFQCMRNAPDSHEFRVVDGRLRYVHTMTVMRSNA